MALPDLTTDGWLPPGLHAAPMAEVKARFGGGAARQRHLELLRQVVTAARSYETIKRVLLWGSFVSAKPEPNDLDYSLVVSVFHHTTVVAPEHRRFFVPFDARQFYGVDRGYLVIPDYPLERHTELLDFVCRDRHRSPNEIVEINLRGEFAVDRVVP